MNCIYGETCHFDHVVIQNPISGCTEKREKKKNGIKRNRIEKERDESEETFVGMESGGRPSI